ncbi:MAG: class I SAM-dependent methyltransferase, partial [Zoogloeaceae bacterium]|nr:class I SAM-dependent methyltransferase [Zoogloeaceae bacterium]
MAFTHNEISAEQLRALLTGMRAAWARGENMMAFARNLLKRNDNPVMATGIAYDLQAGSYLQHALENPENRQRWCAQLADLIAPHLPEGGSLLEVGCGEATTLAGVLANLPASPSIALGFDLSWSRCAYGKTWLERMGQKAELFVADLFHIPLADDSVDVLYTSHSLEPNGGREAAALKEALRVARRAVVLVEPVYELASREAQARMTQHGYVRNLGSVAKSLGYPAKECRLLDFCENPLNPSGVLRIEKSAIIP